MTPDSARVPEVYPRTAESPFNLYRQSFTTSDRSFVQSGSSRFKMQSASIGFSYSFGRPPRSSRGNQGGNEQEGEQEPAQEIR